MINWELYSKFHPSIGQIDSHSHLTWSSEISDKVNELGQFKEGLEIDSEFGFGFGIFDGTGVLTPYSKIGYSNNKDATFHVGTRVLLESGIKLTLVGSQRASSEGEFDQEFKLKGGISW